MASTPAGERHSDPSRGGSGDDSVAAIPVPAMAVTRPRRTGRRLRGLAISSSGRDQREAPRGDHGHADLRRCSRRLHVVALGAVVGWRRRAGHDNAVPTPAVRSARHRDLSRGRGGRDHPDPARPMLRSSRQATVRLGVARPAGAWRQGRGRDPRRSGGADPGPPARRGRSLRRSAGGNGGHRRRRARRYIGHRHQHADRRIGARGGRIRRRGSRCDGQRGVAAWSCARRGSAPILRWRRSPG